jgi:AcrR family transcriptional regulator
MGETSSLAARRTRKSDETRTRILETALDLFRERGFEATTMRDIARESGVALGATYYHFESKEAIVLAFYELAKAELHDPLEEVVERATTLAEGFRALLEVKFAYYKPNKKFLGALFPHSADPHDPMSVFSDQTKHIRQADVEFFERLLRVTGTNFPADLSPYMPGLLWLYQMALLLVWIYDRTENQKRTWLVTEKSLPILVKLIELSRVPFSQPLRRLLIDFFETIVKKV